MGRSVREPLHAYIPERVRREELIRPADRRRYFPKREAQRRLQQKESPWTPIAYAVFLVAVLIIFGFSYTTYAFSKYRGEILPGTHVDQIDLSGMSLKQASRAISAPVIAGHLVPVQLIYQNFRPWQPSRDDLGLGYLFDATAREAMQVGRAGSLLEQLIDRLPLHPSHDVPLLYNYDDHKIRQYIRMHIVTALSKPAANARLVRNGNDFVLLPASDGTQLDQMKALADIHSVLGSLTTHTIQLKVIHLHPSITNTDVNRVRRTVERFLNHTPVINVGKRVWVTSRASFAPMLSFSERQSRGRSTIVMSVDPNRVHAYVAHLASQIDRPARNAKLVFSGGQVQVVSPLQMGRTLDQTTAYNAILKVVTALRPGARLHFKVTVTKPPVDQTNPASLGIQTLLGAGQSSFPEAAQGRLSDVTRIAQALDNVEIPPSGDISFNTLVTTNWANRMYTDRERDANGTPVPADTGAMQQVATTFLRAMYNSGLDMLERHAHNHRLPWYEPPVGLDAVVSPARNWDLRFANTTHKYLLIETRVEPIRQELYIYVYGPKLGWHVSVTKGKVLKSFPHGSQVVQQDPNLAPGDVRQISWPHDGAVVMVKRTITFPDGKVRTDRLLTTYQPSQAIVTVGGVPTATPTPTTSPSPSARSSATPAATPGVTPTPTFNH